MVINEKIPPNQYLYTVTFYDLDVDTLTTTFTITNGDWTYFTIKDHSMLSLFLSWYFLIFFHFMKILHSMHISVE